LTSLRPTPCSCAQVALGYALMLIAMTYQGELFIAVVVGLAVGHVLLNVAAPVSERNDACCVEAAGESLPKGTVSACCAGQVEIKSKSPRTPSA